MNYRADLHCHSTCSDGTLDPLEILHLAKKMGLSGLSITDHDTLNAYNKTLFEEAKKLSLNLFIGAEFSTRHKGRSIHLLGYNMTITSEILKFCEEHKTRRHKRNLAILEKLKWLSFVISEEELYEGREEQVVGRPHIADIMLKKGFVKTIQEAFDRFIGENKCCFDPGPSFSVQETIDQVHKAQGKIFIAHPNSIGHNKTLYEILEMDIDGIECYYSILMHTKEERFLRLAKERNLLISGGSDFHGDIKPHIKLGCSYVDKACVEKIFGPL